MVLDARPTLKKCNEMKGEQCSIVGNCMPGLMLAKHKVVGSKPITRSKLLLVRSAKQGVQRRVVVDSRATIGYMGARIGAGGSARGNSQS